MLPSILLQHLFQGSIFHADDFSPSRDGAATEYDRFLKEGYSSIRDGVPNNAEPPPKSVVIVGWCGDIQDLVDSLELFASGKTTVTVLCDCCPDVRLPLHPKCHVSLKGEKSRIFPVLLPEL